MFESLLAVLGLLVALFLAVTIFKSASEFISGTIVQEGERGVVYRYGKFEQELGPGKYLMVFGRKLTRVSTAEQFQIISGQEILSADRLPIKVTALAAYKITNARKSLEKGTGGHSQAIYFAAQLALRDVASSLPLEALIDARTKLDEDLTAKAKPAFAEHGCELISLAIRDLVLPAEVRRLANDVARARMEAAAALERARGEQAALRALANAARLLKGNPELMNLRVLQALSAGPGKAAPTIILSGGSGIVPVPAGPAGDPPQSDTSEG